MIRCRWPSRRAGAPGQGDVDPVVGQPRLELARVELGGPRLELRLERLLGLVGALADRPALLLGQLGDPAQDRGQLRFAAEVADPQLLELGGARRRRRSRPRPRPRISDIRSEASHVAFLAMAGDDIRSQAIAAAAATLSDSAPPRAQRDRQPRVAALEHLGREALALGAEAERSAAPVEPPRAARRRGRPGPRRGAGVASIPARAGGWAKIEPMLARTAFGENGSAQPGPSDDDAVDQRVGGADDRADVAGVADPVQVDAGGGRAGCRAPLRQTAIARVPEPSVETAASSSGSTSSPPRPAAGRAEQRAAARAPAARPALEQVLALGHEQPLALAVLALAQLAHQLQLLVLGAR